ncbi:MAG TPA: signal peptidase I [Ktedonobacterales bacterium]|nr:signal peptidase I [Ktedonobacterales bacterium]
MTTHHSDRLEFADETPPARPTGDPSRPPVPGAAPREKPAAPSRPLPRRYQPRRSVNSDLMEARRLRMLREILETIAITTLVFLVFRFAFQNYRVDGHSMVPTLQDQQYILVNRAAYLFHPPERGDIIVFAYPLDPSQDFIKRIVGIPGDHVQVDQNGVVSINGVALNEPYVSEITNPYAPTDMTLGPNQYFVLGDNRGNSSDSRDWGPVPRQNIIGQAWFVYWPLGNFHIIPSASSTFSSITP